MQHNDERPPTSGRPSLLSSEQQVEADRHRILGSLDDQPGSAGAGSMRGKRKYSLLAAALLAVVAAGAGSAVWLSGEGEKEIILAGSVPLPAAPSPAAPLASEPAPMNPEASEVSTAAILEDMPASDAGPVAPELKNAGDELTSLLEQSSDAAPVAPPAIDQGPAKEGSAPAPVAGAAAVTADVDSDSKGDMKTAVKPAPKKVVVAKAAPAKPAPKTTPVKTAQKPVPKTAQKSAPKKAVAAAPAKKKAEAKQKAQQDSDVTLLAALVAHSKATQPKKGSAAGEKLKQCKTLGSVAEADQCRARLCASSAKNEAECKAPRLAKAPAES